MQYDVIFLDSIGRDMVASVFRGTIHGLRKTWQGITETLRDAERMPELAPSLPPRNRAQLRKHIRGWLAERGDEISSRRRAAAIGEAYLTLDAEGRRHFLELLARDFGSDRQKVEKAARDLVLAATDDDAYHLAEKRLRDVLVSARIRLLRHFLALPQGVKFLIDLRAELLDHVGSDPALKSFDREMRDLLATWFDIGFLELHHITWNSPAALLEKLIAYEAVHEIHSWDDLRNRLESDRRCYAFFHPAMLEEPLIFVEVALVNGISGNIQALLDQQAPEIHPEKADTAIFYSISNAQKGLRGISFGNFLIKEVVEDLRHEFPNLRTFCTLSPLPGFARWLGAVLSKESTDPDETGCREALREAADRLGVPNTLEDVLQHPDWYRRDDVTPLLRDPLERLCARYLHRTGTDGTPLDPVERFHLGNGARIERLNWLGDVSSKGVRQSCTLMVNYLYKLDDIARNQQAYAADGRVAVSGPIRVLLRPLGEEGGRRAKLTRILRISLPS